jgi:chromosome segregation ATPase
MSKEEKKESSDIPMLIDDIKKKVGSQKEYVDNNFDLISKSLKGIQEEFFRKINDLDDKLKVYVDDFSSISERSFMAINMVKSLKDEVIMKDTWKNDLETLIENHKNWFKKIENDLEEKTRLSIDRYSSLNSDMKMQDKGIYDLSDKVKELLVRVENILNVSEELCIKIHNFKTELDENSEESVKNKEDIGNIGMNLGNLSATLDDIFREVSSVRSYAQENLKSLNCEIKEKAEVSSIREIQKEIKDLKEVVETIPKKRPDEEQLSSTWKQQMELKIARIEKKLNA